MRRWPRLPGIGLLFAPSVDEMYPDGFATSIDPGPLARVLEGVFRPGHFAGVATVCTKLFNATGPSVAYFGRKDAQQVAVIKHVVRDLDLPLEIAVVPTVRDPDGLALSSRNVYLGARSAPVPWRCPAACRPAWRPIATVAEPMARAPRLATCSRPPRGSASTTSTSPTWTGSPLPPRCVWARHV